jgi:SSS family solute:Na+ symporter
MHYIDFMVVTLVTSVLAALIFNRLVINRKAEFIGFALFRAQELASDRVAERPL